MVRSTSHSDYLAPVLTTGLHFLILGVLTLNLRCLHDYSDPLFPWFWCGICRTLFLLTLTAYLVLSTRDPGFVTNMKQETSLQNPSYRNTTDPTAMDQSKKNISKKPLHSLVDIQEPQQDGNFAHMTSRPSKEDTPKATDTYKYYEFSDPAPVNMHTDEDSHAVSDEQRQGEVQGNAGSQVNDGEDAAHFHLSKADLPPQPNAADTEKAKSELDTSEVREGQMMEDVQEASRDILPIGQHEAENGGSRFEDIDLSGSSTIIVEVRYCTVCKVEQPMRAKHCKECGLCVALHDHHCPWLGICIGERTRCYFFGYLVLECSLLWVTFILVAFTQAISGFHHKETFWGWTKSNGLLLFATLIVALFTLMVSCLLCFHTYLASSNLTTCSDHVGEVASWEKISYLKQWPRAFGSPFTRGFLGNLRLYCCTKLSPYPLIWKMPKQIPEQPTKRQMLCC